MFLPAFAALREPASRTYYERTPGPRKGPHGHFSAWPVSGSTCCARCSATALSTNPEPHASLDERHRATPLSTLAAALAQVGGSQSLRAAATVH